MLTSQAGGVGQRRTIWSKSTRDGDRQPSAGKRSPNHAFRRVPSVVMLLFLGVALSCSHQEKPEAQFARAHQLFLQGDLIHSQQEAAAGYQRFKQSSPEWAAKFTNLEAESLLWSGMYEQALALLAARPSPAADRSSRIFVLSLAGAAHARLRHFEEAAQALNTAERLCKESPDTACGGVMRALGVLASERGQQAEARKYFEESLAFSRAHHDPLLETTALLNLGVAALREGHFDEAVDLSDDAYKAALAIGNHDLAQNIVGNLGWAYYRLGNSERALELFLDAKSRAAGLGDINDEAAWSAEAGYVYLDMHAYSEALKLFTHALQLEEAVRSTGDIYVTRRVLARLALQNGNLAEAEQHASEARRIARQSGNRAEELYPILVEGQIAARRGRFDDAAKTIREVEEDKACPVFLKWEAQHSLAQIAEDEGLLEQADRRYQAALATFETARHDVHREDLKLSFLTNGWRIYDDYVRFLVEHGRANDALRWADFSRARTLANGLGLLSKVASTSPPPLDASRVAARARGVILFYWLGESQSYLWVVTPATVRELTLPAGAIVEAAVDRYRKALAGPEDVLRSADRDGRWLYATLIAPAERLLPNNAKVLIIPDGNLNNLNFETLLVEQPQLHFWIEDVTVANASSLRLLDAPANSQQLKRNLLLIGNSLAPNDKYPELARAAAQMEGVAQRFPAGQRKVVTREQATPDAYLNGNPEHYSYIHFVAHGVASRSSPLDSAIVLSRPNASSDAFKLYARDVISHPLHADLVTISACYSAGERAYSGEGLVGLSWAFLRAGARNVIAALWEASDVSTVQLMDRFYDELNHGAAPDAALRSAKLSLLHESGFRNPFYWAPFQLYGPGNARTSH